MFVQRWDDLSDSGCCSGGLVITGFILQLAAAFGVVLIIIGFIGFVASEIVALKTKGKVRGLGIKAGRRIAPLLPAASLCVTKIENGFDPHDAAMWYGGTGQC